MATEGQQIPAVSDGGGADFLSTPPKAAKDPATDVVVERQDLNFKQLWGHALVTPVPEHAKQLSGLCRALYEQREELVKCLVFYFFGPETDWVEGASDGVRSSLEYVGMGSLAEAILGAANTEKPPPPPPHTQLYVRRTSSGQVEAQAWPWPDTDPMPMPSVPGLQGYGDAALSAVHMQVDVGQPTAHSDLEARCYVGAHDRMVEDLLRGAVQFERTLAWLAENPTETARFKELLEAAFSRSAKVVSSILSVERAEFSACTKEGGIAQLTFRAPLKVSDPDSEEQKLYPTLSSFLSLLNPYRMVWRHLETDATLLEVTLQEGFVQFSCHMKDGRLYWVRESPFEPVEPVSWSEDGKFSFIPEVEFSLVPLGVSLASIPFPRTSFHCDLWRSGSVKVVCVDCQETVPGQFDAAWVAFDMGHFRKLLRKVFRFTVNHVAPGHANEGWTVQAQLRFAFPSSSVLTLLVQWFRDIFLRQTGRLETVKFLADLLLAWSADAAELSDCRSRQALGEEFM